MSHIKCARQNGISGNVSTSPAVPLRHSYLCQKPDEVLVRAHTPQPIWLAIYCTAWRSPNKKNCILLLLWRWGSYTESHFNVINGPYSHLGQDGQGQKERLKLAISVLRLECSHGYRFKWGNPTHLDSNVHFQESKECIYFMEASLKCLKSHHLFKDVPVDTRHLCIRRRASGWCGSRCDAVWSLKSWPTGAPEDLDRLGEE